MTTRSARCSGTAFTDEQKKDALRLAKGLFESKVLVNRPPTTAQRDIYNSGRPRTVPNLSHGAKKKKSNQSKKQLVNPVWRPFSHDKLLSQIRQEIQCGKGEKTKSGSNLTNDQNHEISEKGAGRLPSGVALLEPWITEEDYELWTGIPSDPNCFVLLPSGFHPDANCLPPLQNHDDPLLERPAQEIKKYVPPRILHNYNYLENEESYKYHHDRKQCSKSEPRENTKKLRTSEIIRREIEDLERLLQGFGNPNSSSIVNRYQHEITTLKEMVIETLRDYTVDVDIPKEVESTIYHGDLFDFLARHDEIIAAIKEKRDACVKELARLEREIRQEND